MVGGQHGDAGASPSKTRRERIAALSAEAKERRAGLQRRLDTAVEGLQSHRSANTAVDVGFLAHARDERVGGGILAGALTFRVFLFLLPLVLMLVGLLGLFADEVGDAVRNAGLRALAQRLDDVADQADRGWYLTLTLGAFFAYSTAKPLLKLLRTAHRFAWELPLQRERVNAKQVALFLAFVVVVLAVNAGAGIAREKSGGIGLGANLAIGVAFAGLWLFASLRLPHADKARWTALVPGALLVGIGALALHLVTVYWLSGKLSRASNLYGSLGVAIAMLLWLYIVSRLIIGAAVLNAALWERKTAAVSRIAG